MRTLAMLNNRAATTSYMAEQLSSIPPATVSFARKPTLAPCSPVQKNQEPARTQPIWIRRPDP